MTEFEQTLSNIDYVAYNCVLDELLQYLIKILNAEEAIFCINSQGRGMLCVVAHQSVNANSVISANKTEGELCKGLEEFPYLSALDKEMFRELDFQADKLILPFIKEKANFAIIQSIEFGTVTSGYFIITRNNVQFAQFDSNIILNNAKLACTHLRL
jgi:hypothetical protein